LLSTNGVGQILFYLAKVGYKHLQELLLVLFKGKVINYALFEVNLLDMLMGGLDGYSQWDGVSEFTFFI